LGVDVCGFWLGNWDVVADERALVTAGTVENKVLFFLAASALRERRVTPLETSIVDDGDDGSGKWLAGYERSLLSLFAKNCLYLGIF
jgi:hypothetical protein